MLTERWLGSYSIRHAISVGIAVGIALLVSNFYSFAAPGWIVLTTFLVSQTTRGTPLRQNIISFFLLVAVAAIFGIIYPFFMNVLDDVLIGGVIGILGSQLIFPVRTFAEFKKGVTPLLQAVFLFNKNVLTCLQEQKEQELKLLETNLIVAKALQEQYGMYPEWVYEVGFNPGLRAGYRFFLINIERLSDIVFVMQYRLTTIVDIGFFRSILPELMQVLAVNNELIEIILNYFANIPYQATQQDYTSDVAALENVLQHNIPNQLELLDVYPENLTLVSMVRDVKDMRHVLLQLVLALPKNVQ